MSWVAATDERSFRSFREHLLRGDGQEDICFAIWRPGTAENRSTALIDEPLLPGLGDREVHGNASFTSKYFLRAAQEARDAGGGLALLHSHPGGRGWQDMSDDDVAAERGHAAQAEVLTGLPLVGMTIAGDGALSGRVWERAAIRDMRRTAFESVRVVGSRLRITFDPALRPAPRPGRRQVRTVSAWGEETQADIARLRVGIVGAGSVGSFIAEILARTGVGELVLIDFDTVEEHNLDRLLHATARDVRRHRSKVDVLALRLPASASNPHFEVVPVEASVVEPDGYAAAASCDVLFSCVDRPWARHALNVLAYAHLIPVVDGGIAARAGTTGLRRADWRAHLAAPGRRCLHCLGQYEITDVGLEREGYLDDPNYIAGLPDDHPGRRSENVMAFTAAVAAAEVLQLLSALVAPGGVPDTGAHTYHFVGAVLDRDTRGCDEVCVFSDEMRARGDRCGSDPTGVHTLAEERRAQRRRARGWRGRLDDRLDRWRIGRG